MSTECVALSNSTPPPAIALFAFQRPRIFTRLQNEFSAIGFYLSSHPLAAYERSLQRLGVTRAADLAALLARGAPGRIKLAGTVIDRQERTSAKGNRFAFVQCSDQSGAFELTVFSELLGSKRNLLEAGQAVLVSVDGRLDGEQVKLTAQSVEKLDDAVANAAAGLRVLLSDPAALEALRKGARKAASLGLEVHAGHGLTYANVGAIAAIPEIVELQIGHFLIGEAVFAGLDAAIKHMRAMMDEARGTS